MATNKSLGQHWLKDRQVLESIANEANLTKADTVLEVGPGLGTLTSVLLRQAGVVVAVELDSALAKKLPAQFPGTSLKVVNQDFLQFDLNGLPAGYKVVANVPYYITSKIVETLLTSTNPPLTTVILIQKEVAERLVADSGAHSILSISAQIYAKVHLGPVVGKEYFTPPPKVDSQVVVFEKRHRPLVAPSQQKWFFRVVKAGFSAKRKKIKTSLAGGLNFTKEQVGRALDETGIREDLRAQDLTIEQWQQLAAVLQKSAK